MSEARYPNRDALRQANDIYLDTMRPFIIHYLKQISGETVEDLIGDALKGEQADKFWEILDKDNDIESAIDFNYIPQIIQKEWNDAFGQRLNWNMNFQSMLWLIREGRNSCEHRGKKDLDSEFVRINLFLIADVLGKINRPDEQREVEGIRDALFADDTAERLEKAEKRLKDLESEKSEAEKRLEDVQEYERTNTALSKQVDEKENQRKKLDKQLKKAKAQNDKYKKDIAGTKQRLEKSEAAQADYKDRLETTSKELKGIHAEWKETEERRATELNQLAAAQSETKGILMCLRSVQNLFTVAAIGEQEVQEVFQSVYPPIETDFNVRMLDRRGVDKKSYLLELLGQKQPTLIYVQSEKRIDQLLTLVGPEKAGMIARHDKQTSEAEEVVILEKLRNGELIAVVSDTTFSTLALSHSVEHFVFCHLTPDLDEFFERCQSAFASEKNAYLHLIYESKQDIEKIAEKFLDENTLRELYKKFRDCTPMDGNLVNPANLYDKLCKDRELKITELGIETSLSIFEELGFLKQNEEGIKRVSPPSTKTQLEKSGTYCRGEKLKKEIANSPAFQYEQSIEQIWEEILAKLNVDSEQILRESNLHKVDFKVLETKVDVQSTIGTEQDKVTPPTPEVWPQRTLSAFDSLRQRASRNLHDTNDLIQPIDVDAGGVLNSPSGQLREVDEIDFQAPNSMGDENKYDLAIQFAREYGVNALEQGIALLIENQNNPNYDFTEGETNMLHAFQDALKDFQTQSEQPAEEVDDDNTMANEDAEAKPTPKSTPANAKVTEEQVREIRSRSAAGEANSELAEEDTEKKPEVKQSEFWQPIRAGEFGALFAGKPVPVRDDGWISKRIRGVEIILSFRKNRSYVSFLCTGENRIERRDEIIVLFPEADYDYYPRESDKRAGFGFHVINKGKDHPEDWDEIRKKLVAMGTDIYNKIDESGI